MNAPRSLAYYLRVSTVSQDYPSQMHALKEFCRRQGWKVPPRKDIFAEKISGKRVKRTQLDRLLQACRDGIYDTIVTYRLDRLGNSLQHMVNVQTELIDGLKIRLVGAADSIDSAIENAALRHHRNTMNNAAEYNRELISERTRSGLAAARAAGRHPGRPRKKEKQIALALKLHAAHGLGARELHRRTGLSIGYLSDLITGKRKAPPKPKTKK